MERGKNKNKIKIKKVQRNAMQCNVMPRANPRINANNPSD